MKNVFILIIICIMSISLTNCTKEKSKNTNKCKDIDTIPMLVSQIQRCSKLYTAEYKVHKIITHDDKVRVKGKILNHDYNISLPMGERKVAIPMNATIKAYIDFTDFSAKNIKRNGRNVEIILPDPKVELTATKISHAEIKKYVALMRQNFTDEELSNYELQGREAIIKDIPQMGITQMAKESAAKIIVPLFVGLGYKDSEITVTFRKDFTAREIMKMIDPTTVIEGR